MQLCLLLCALLALLLPSTASRAASARADTLFLAARPAFNGHYRVGGWLPVHVELRNEGPDRTVEVRAAPFKSAAQYAATVELPNGAQKVLTLYVYMPAAARRLDVTLLVDAAVVTQQRLDARVLPGRARTIAVASGEGRLPPLPRRVAGNASLEAFALTLAELPENVAGLSAIDTLLLHDMATSEMNVLQRAAIEAWVLRGGHLIVSGGAGLERTLAGLPETLKFVADGGLQTISAAAFFPNGGDEILSIASLRPLDNPERLQPYALPLRALPAANTAIEQTFGQGAVTVFAADLLNPALAEVSADPQFWDDLLKPVSQLPTGFAPDDVSLDTLTSSNLASSLTSLPALEFPSPFLLLGLLGTYIVLVGPVTYLVLRRLDRQAWGWFVIPTLTMVFATAAFGISYAQRGGDVLLNELALVEVLPPGASSSLARTRSFVGVFSPTQRMYDMEVVADDAAPLLHPISVQGVWDATFATQAGRFYQEPLALESLATARDFEVARWALRALSTDTLSPAPPLEARVFVGDQQLRGEVTNTSTLPLEDVVLVQGNRVLRFGTMAPGERREGTFELVQEPNMGLASLSYLAYAPQIDEAARSNGMWPPLVQLRTRILDAYSGYGPSPRSAEPLLIAWLPESALDVRLTVEKAAHQRSALLVQSPEIVAAQGQMQLDAAWLKRQALVSAGQLCYGMVGLGVNVLDQPVEIVYTLPRSLFGMQPSSLRLRTSADMSWPAGMSLELFDWQGNSWHTLQATGKPIVVEDPARFFGSHGRMKVRLTQSDVNATGSGCVYVDAELTGAMP
jgi:hypothetical protein